MPEVVNLRLARKRKERAAREVQAAENRATHGRSGGENAVTSALRNLEAQRLDMHRRDNSDGGERSE